MRNSIFWIALTALVLYLPAAPLLAINWAFLDLSADQNMTDEDHKMLEEAAIAAFALAAGEASTWSNPDSGNSGTVTPVATLEKSGMPCRRLEFQYTGGQFSERYVFTICKSAEDKWVIAE